MTNPWPALADAPRPTDEFVGPFPEEPFLNAWWEIFGAGDPITAGDDTSLLPLVSVSGTVRCAGQENLTDYHSPRGNDLAPIAESILEIGRSHNSIVLDSLPEVSARELFDQMKTRGAEVTIVEGMGAAVIEVGDDYLAGLSKKQRHEVRRKLRRYEETVGVPVLSTSIGSDALDRFVNLHRLAMGEKADFFDGATEQFFSVLAGSEDWEFAELKANGDVVASLFGC